MRKEQVREIIDWYITVVRRQTPNYGFPPSRDNDKLHHLLMGSKCSLFHSEPMKSMMAAHPRMRAGRGQP